MRVSFDSNAWEAIFSPDDIRAAPIRAALADGRVDGFICEAGFRIEAITKRNRPSYFAQPYMDVVVKLPTSSRDGVFAITMSIGPDDPRHPGLPAVQAEKLKRALAAGIRLMCGHNWMGLPRPQETSDPSNFVHEEGGALREREERQLEACTQIEARGLGKAMFDAADGWMDRPRTPAEEKQLVRACAEWADGELVEAHIAYRNDLLCTNDLARAAGRSVFDAANRAWLATHYGVTFLTLDELTAKVAA